MQKVSQDMLIMDIVNAMAAQMELSRLNEVKNILYMHLNNIEMYKEDSDTQLPSGYIDDTPATIKLFLDCLRLEKRTESTIQCYRLELTKFFECIRKHYADVTAMDVRSYLAWRQTVLHNADSTVNNKIHTLQSFYKWVMSEDTLDDGGLISRKPVKNPMAKIKTAKPEVRVREPITEIEMEIIRCCCRTERDLALVDVMAGTGMRISELCALNRSDVDIRHGRCVIYGKGRKERPAFFTPKAIVHLENYLASRKDNHPALFVNKHRVRNKLTGEMEYKRITGKGVTSMLKEIPARDKRIEHVNLHPHCFRYYLATMMYRHGAPAEDIQLILGHCNVRTTLEHYILRNTDDAYKAHSRYAG